MRFSYNASIALRATSQEEVAGQFSIVDCLRIVSGRKQTVRVTELKCLQRSLQSDRAARKGTSEMLPGAKNTSSKAKVADGRPQPRPENSLHYCLLLGDGDINNRGEDDEGW